MTQLLHTALPPRSTLSQEFACGSVPDECSTPESEHRRLWEPWQSSSVPTIWARPASIHQCLPPSEKHSATPGLPGPCEILAFSVCPRDQPWLLCARWHAQTQVASCVPVSMHCVARLHGRSSQPDGGAGWGTHQALLLSSVSSPCPEPSVCFPPSTPPFRQGPVGW